MTKPGGRIGVLELDQETAFLDHPDSETTRTIVGTFARAMAQGQIGRQLPRLLRAARLADGTVMPTVALGSAGFWLAGGAGGASSGRQFPRRRGHLRRGRHPPALKPLMRRLTRAHRVAQPSPPPLVLFIEAGGQVALLLGAYCSCSAR